MKSSMERGWEGREKESKGGRWLDGSSHLYNYGSFGFRGVFSGVMCHVVFPLDVIGLAKMTVN